MSTAAARRRDAGPPARLRGLARGVDLALGGAPEDLGEEVGLGREVAVDGAGRHAGPRRYRGDLRLAVAAAGDEPVRRAHDALAGGRAAGLGALGRAVRHAKK